MKAARRPPWQGGDSDARGEEAADPLPGDWERPEEQQVDWPEKPARRGPCSVTLLDPARRGMRCCDGNPLVIPAPARTAIEPLYRDGGPGFGRPVVSVGRIADEEVVYFDGGAYALELPVRLAARRYVPLAIGVARPNGRRGSGSLRANQRKGDGELSAGYKILLR